MNPAFTVAATVLVAALFPLTFVALRRSLVSGLIALQAAGILATLALVCYSVGAQSSSSTGLALVTAFMTWLSGLLYVRFMGRQR